MSAGEPLLDRSVDPPVRGMLHSAVGQARAGLVLAHGAGANSNAPLLVALATGFVEAGICVLRCDLPFRQVRPHGPPGPGDAKRDRAGLANAYAKMKQLVPADCPVFLGGHSYGGRQSSMLAAENPGLVAGLLLLSYPLHPPRKPEQLRTQHFPELRTPALFVHGTRDPFGSIEELSEAIKLIPAQASLLPAEGAGHDLGFKGKAEMDGLTQEIVAAFSERFAYR